MKPHQHSRKLFFHPPSTPDRIQSHLPHPNLSSVEAFSTSTFSSAPSKSPGNSPLNPTSAFTALSLLVAFSFFGIFIVYVACFGNRHRQGDPPPPSTSLSLPPKGLDPSTIRSLPIYSYSGDSVDNCAICLSEFDEDSTVKMIPFCKHVFHPECIDTWLFSHVSCPVCRSTRFFEAEDGMSGTSGGGSSLCAVKEDYDQRVSESGGRSTVANGDTSVDVGSFGMRRICSCTSFAGQVSQSLHRTCSF